MATIRNRTHSFKDPAHLTAYEAKLVEMRESGMSYAQMSQHLKLTVKTVTARYKIIREKLELQRLAC
jgi:hypothetical protein